MECRQAGCQLDGVLRGLCRPHYMQEWGRGRTEAGWAEKPDRTCAFCGTTYKPIRQRADARFCSRKCKDAARVADGRSSLSSRKAYFKRQYGITLEDVEKMAALGCAICGTTDWNGRHARPKVDHDHVTGEVRGVLCSECNMGLGKFKDDPALVRAALRYLET